MRAPGPLPLHLRNYIAILASSRFKCSYLVHQQEEEFIVNGGDPHWLQGVEYSDPKIKKLLEVNAILAHQPWLLNKGALEVWLMLQKHYKFETKQIFRSILETHTI